MMIINWVRGHPCYYDGGDWRYLDTEEIVNDDRPCKRCGRFPVNGEDACCGHGNLNHRYVKYRGKVLRGAAVRGLK